MISTGYQNRLRAISDSNVAAESRRPEHPSSAHDNSGQCSLGEFLTPKLDTL